MKRGQGCKKIIFLMSSFMLISSLVLYENSSFYPTLINDIHMLERFTVFESDLLGPGKVGSSGCPPGCGCWESGKDCPRLYSFDAVKKSANADDPKLLAFHAAQLAKARETASAFCNAESSSKTVATGGSCLSPEKDGEIVQFPDGTSYRMAKFHSPPSRRVATGVVDLFRRGNISSVNDFGAGIGQYKSAITNNYQTFGMMRMMGQEMEKSTRKDC